MLIYNVTVKVNPEINNDWVKWMKEEHMPELMKTGLFMDAKLFLLLEVDDVDGVTYAAQYHCETIEHYQDYIDNHSKKFRQDGLDRFGEQFIAFRTIMKTV